MRTLIFHEIYGSYYRAVSAILRRAVAGELTGPALNAIVREYAFGESLLTIPDALRGERWRLLHRDLSTPLVSPPSMPLSTLEKRWMKTLLLDPRIRLFAPDEGGLEAVEPLFDPGDIVWYDRYTDGDDYTDPAYIERFRCILGALREGQNLHVCFESGRHAAPALVVTPRYLEYSGKDDRFRLVAEGHRRRWTINLARIRSCEIARDTRPRPPHDAVKASVTFVLTDRRNAMNRVLLHFSDLEKETKRLDGQTYRVTLRYDRQDETELVIRILSFGPVIRVLEPQHFIDLLRNRIAGQRQLVPVSPGQGSP